MDMWDEYMKRRLSNEGSQGQPGALGRLMPMIQSALGTDPGKPPGLPQPVNHAAMRSTLNQTPPQRPPQMMPIGGDDGLGPQIEKPKPIGPMLAKLFGLG